ncbi:MAG: transporter substrate-binding domain-containing protein [Selenomonadaceae bacterium]|nr:transporter substrate-binding domain-containing protein [Selenomonadaceae bacterium]
MLGKITAAFLLFLSLILGGIGSDNSTALAASRIVRVGYLLEAGFQEGAAGEAKSGYGYEYLQEISYYTNWQYEYVYDRFDALMDKLRRGEIDLMGGVVKTPERESQLLFSILPCGIEDYYIYFVAGRSGITIGQPSSLSYKTVGIAPGRYQTELFNKYCVKNNLQCMTVPIESQSARELALSNGLVDAIISTPITRLSTQDNRFVMGSRVGRTDTYFAVTRKNPDILDELNYAIRQINGKNPLYNEENYLKYVNSGTIVSAVRADDEKYFIEKNPILTVGYVQGVIPYCDTELNSSTSVSGILPEALRHISSVTGLNFRYVPFETTGQMIYALKEGKINIALPVGGDPWAAEEQNIIITKPVTQAKMALAYQREGTTSYRELLKRVAVPIQNESHAYFIRCHYPQAQIDYYANMQECLIAVRSGKADSVVIDSDVFNNQNAQRRAINAAYREFPLPEVYGVSMAVAAGNSTLQALLNRGISSLPAGIVNDARIKAMSKNDTSGDSSFMWTSAVITAALIVLLLLIVITWIYRKLQKSQQETQLMSELLEQVNRGSLERATVYEALCRTVRNFLDDIETNAIGLKSAKPAENFRAITNIRTIGQGLDTIMNDVLDISRIEIGEVPYTREKLDLDRLLRRIVEDGEQLGAHRQVSIDSNIYLLHKEVYTSPRQLEYIIRQLMTLAVIYSCDGHTASLNVTELIDDLAANKNFAFFRFIIADSGIGMTEAQLRQIFTPHYPLAIRTDDLTYTSRLSNVIAKKLVESMNGTISVTSEKGEGTYFTIILPLELAGEENPIHEEVTA